MDEKFFKGIGSVPVERISGFRDIILDVVSEMKNTFLVRKDTFDYEDMLNRYETLVYNLDKSYRDLTENELISYTLKCEIAEDLLNNFDIETLSVIDRIKNDLNIVATNTYKEDETHKIAEQTISLLTSFGNSVLDFTEKTRDMICFGDTYEDEDYDLEEDEDYDLEEDEDYDLEEDEDYDLGEDVDLGNGISIHYGHGVRMELSFGDSDEDSE